MPRTTIAVVVMPGLDLLPAVWRISPYICADFASPGYLMGWNSFGWGQGLRLGGFSPPSPGLATSLGILFVKRSVHRSSYHFPTEAQHVATELQLLTQILPRRNRRSTTYEVLPEWWSCAGIQVAIGSFSASLVCSSSMACASKLISICSVKLDIIQITSCTAYSRLPPISRTIIYCQTTWTWHAKHCLIAFTFSRLQFYYSYVISWRTGDY